MATATVAAHTCPRCGAEFDSKNKLSGHMGGAHGRDLVPIRHGTENGYVQHVRRRIPIEDDDECGCRLAHATFQRERRHRLSA